MAFNGSLKGPLEAFSEPAKASEMSLQGLVVFRNSGAGANIENQCEMRDPTRLNEGKAGP